MNNNVTDYDNHRIQVLNFDLTFSFTFGERGQDSSRLSNPCGITCDSAGNAYVVDSGNHRIQVFTAEGEFLRMFGQKGKGRDEFNVPVGIALHSDNNHMFVSDYYNECISVFTVEGQFVTSFDCGFSPCGLAVDNCGVVYVCNRGGKCVQVY